MEHIAEALRATVDFPRLVEAMYQRGYQHFIEVGPGRTCARWIEGILGGRAHVASQLTAAAMALRPPSPGCWPGTVAEVADLAVQALRRL